MACCRAVLHLNSCNVECVTDAFPGGVLQVGKGLPGTVVGQHLMIVRALIHHLGTLGEIRPGPFHLALCQAEYHRGEAGISGVHFCPTVAMAEGGALAGTKARYDVCWCTHEVFLEIWVTLVYSTA
jgi:hypothetical protein